jgi:A/G-specific adenine glycosylase
LVFPTQETALIPATISSTMPADPPCTSSDPNSNPQVAHRIEAWFAENRRDYPWRNTADPYAILVSEVMLQQTQIATVLDGGYYSRWLAAFPDFATLAAASEEAVLSQWQGLGYYRRARNLQKLAQVIVRDHDGQMPSDPVAILALPGIGPYTAGAIASFAFGLPEPIVDGNVARVLMRLHNDATPIDGTAGQALLWQRARALVSQAQSPAALNSGLMELGQTLCRSTSADCSRCPLQSDCRASSPLLLPVKSKKVQLTDVTERVFFAQTDEGVLLEQESGPRRTGMWKLPQLCADEPLPKVLHKLRYGITRYKVTLWVHAAPVQWAMDSAVLRYVPRAELLALPIAAPYRKALAALDEGQAGFRLE